MWTHIHDTFPVLWLPLAPRAFLSPPTFSGKELTNNWQSLGEQLLLLVWKLPFPNFISAVFVRAQSFPTHSFHFTHNFISFFHIFLPEPLQNFEQPYCFSFNLLHFALSFLRSGRGRKKLHMWFQTQHAADLWRLTGALFCFPISSLVISNSLFTF